MPPPGKKPKYNNVKVEYDGKKFDSTAECNRYKELRWLEDRGMVQRLEVHPKYELWVNGILIATYTADTRYQIGGRLVVEDVKSTMTAKLRAWRLVKKLMLAVHRIAVTEVIR